MKHKRKRTSVSRTLSACVLALLLAGAGAGSVYAYLRWQSGPVTNTFSPASSAEPEIKETFTENVKSEVSVSVGDPGYSVYVRAAVIVNWKDGSGNIWRESPVEGKDYAVEWNLTDWTKKSDGYYYYNEPVSSGGSTEVLIKSCRPLREAPEESYSLDVRIAAQTVQAAGTTDSGNVPAVTDAWGP